MTDACYVYGIVPAGAAVDEKTSTAGLGDGVEIVDGGSVAALVEVVDPSRPIGTRKDLVAHSAVLNAMAERGAVLPLRFGSVMHSREAVVDDLLRAQQEHFVALLEQLAGRAQFTLRARYELDVVLAEVVSADPQIRELRERTADVPEDASHFDRIRLGEMVAQAIDVKRQQDGEGVLDALAPHAVSHLVKSVSGMDDLIEISFLVKADQREVFEQTAEGLAEQMAGRVKLRLVGPMAAYDFVPEQ